MVGRIKKDWATGGNNSLCLATWSWNLQKIHTNNTSKALSTNDSFLHSFTKEVTLALQGMYLYFSKTLWCLSSKQKGPTGYCAQDLLYKTAYMYKRKTKKDQKEVMTSRGNLWFGHVIQSVLPHQLRCNFIMFGHIFLMNNKII